MAKSSRAGKRAVSFVTVVTRGLSLILELGMEEGLISPAIDTRNVHPGLGAKQCMLPWGDNQDPLFFFFFWIISAPWPLRFMGRGKNPLKQQTLDFSSRLESTVSLD